MNSSWRPVSNGIPQGSILAPIPPNIAINGLHNEAEHTPSKLADDTKRAGMVTNTPEDKAIQSDCNSLEKQTHKNLKVQQKQMHSAVCGTE